MLRRLTRVLLTLAALGWVPWLVMTAVDLGDHWQVAAAVAFLPYVLVGTALVGVASLLARAWAAAALALLGLLVLGVPRADRVMHSAQPAAGGERIVVATSNVYVGEGDMRQLAQIVRREGVDLLAVQENTPASDTRLRAALGERLPHVVSMPDRRPGAAGIALLSAGPLEPNQELTKQQRARGGTVTTPGGTQLTAFSVHPYPPFSDRKMRSWRRNITSYGALLTGRPAAERRPSLLLGDFNATLDHHPLRTLLGDGFRDAAEQAGEAWHPTWAQPGRRLTIDHVLVGPGIAVERVTVLPLTRSDHHVVVATLRLPAR